MKIAIVGLGNMGRPIAENIMKAGYSLTVYNRTKEKAADLLDKGAEYAETPRQAAEHADIVLSMLSDDDAVTDVTFGACGIIAGLSENGIHISMSTISTALSEQLSAAHSGRGQSFIAAPDPRPPRCRREGRASHHHSRTGGSEEKGRTAA